MKQMALIVCMLFMTSMHELRASYYLWQHQHSPEQACCLYFAGADICNPNSMCTGNQHADLTGIYNYLSRFLSTERGMGFSYKNLLQQAQFFIGHVFARSIRLGYRIEHRLVHYFHEMDGLDVPVTKPASKEKPKANGKTTLSTTGKTQPAATSSSSSAEKTTAKADHDAAVTAYLTKIGVARPLK